MFNQCISRLKMSILHNKKVFEIHNNKNNLNLLKTLLKINIIKFIKIEDKKIFVFVNYVNNKPVFCNIINLFKPGHKMYISLKNLKKIGVKKNWILILSTSKGVLNSFEAINKGVGGLLITKIWN